MKRAMVLACVFGLSLGTQGLAGDVEKAEAGVKDLIKLMQDLTGVLKTMTDEDTVKAAEPKLKKIGARRKELMEKLKSIEKDLSKDDQEAVKSKFGKQVDAGGKALKAEVKRVEKLPGGADALKLVGPFFGPRDGKKEEKKDK